MSRSWSKAKKRLVRRISSPFSRNIASGFNLTSSLSPIPTISRSACRVLLIRCVASCRSSLKSKRPSYLFIAASPAAHWPTRRSRSTSFFRDCIGAQVGCRFLAITIACDPLTDAERKTIQSLPGDIERWRSDCQVLSGVAVPTEAGCHPYEQTWRKPAATVIAQEASSIKGASNQVLPRASAIVSCRIVPDQDPDAVLASMQAFLSKDPPWGAR